MATPVVVIPADGTAVPAIAGRYAVLMQDANRNQAKGSVSTQVLATSSLSFSYESCNDTTPNALSSYSLLASTTSNSAGDTANGTGAVSPAALDVVHVVNPNARWTVINVASGSGTFAPVSGDGVKFL